MVDRPIVEVRDLRKTFAVKYAGGVSTLHASSGVNFDIMRGETLELVGESGSGKTAPPVFAGEGAEPTRPAARILFPPAPRICDGTLARRSAGGAKRRSPCRVQSLLDVRRTAPFRADFMRHYARA